MKAQKVLRDGRLARLLTGIVSRGGGLWILPTSRSRLWGSLPGVRTLDRQIPRYGREGASVTANLGQNRHISLLDLGPMEMYIPTRLEKAFG